MHQCTFAYNNTKNNNSWHHIMVTRAIVNSGYGSRDCSDTVKDCEGDMCAT